ncbi:hypothetical protein Misp01_79470 [Microtetraspora sp. NBRC 13810]|nr:hypothetical protein Misp01_79470 [Microtetraspora sp. NBRC 13810]
MGEAAELQVCAGGQFQDGGAEVAGGGGYLAELGGGEDAAGEAEPGEAAVCRDVHLKRTGTRVASRSSRKVGYGHGEDGNASFLLGTGLA